MAKLYVFAIGGTGSRTLRSLTMLMMAGVRMGVDEVVPIIIDPDAANADLTRTVSLMSNYRQLRSELSFAGDVETPFFRTALTQVSPNYTLHIKDTDDKKLREFIDLAGMGKDTQAMMRMLFSEKNLNAGMSVGFKGNPNIGSVVLNQVATSPDFESFANSFSQGDKIFIISSIFGGTGASGFPLLLKTLRGGNTFSNNDLINKAEIGALSVLPYFKLKTDDNSEIDSSTFISKTKSALAYYERNIAGNQSVNALYYLADDTQSIYDNNEGGSAQRNDAHLIEFLAATAIVDFSNKEHPETVHKELGLRDTRGAVSFATFYEDQHELLFLPMTELAMLAGCLCDKFGYYSSPSFNANTRHFKGLYGSPMMRQLRELTAAYREWLGEMKGNKRSLDLFNLEATDKPFDVVTGYKPKKIMSPKSDYDLVTDRLNTAVGKCRSKEDKSRFLEMYHLGLKRLIREKFGNNQK